MWQTILLSFSAGVMGANATPHFVKGITKESYPNLLGNTPVPNVVAGWAGLVIACGLAWAANGPLYPLWSFAAGSIGVLVMGLFHAWIGAFGRKS